MKKSKKTALTAAIFATAMNFTACTSPDVDIQTEYGAPIAIPEETYKPEEEEEQDVYGPPAYFDDTAEEETTKNIEEASEESEPENPSEEASETLEEIIEEYEPKMEMPRLVYGPPEAFEGE